jgi:ribosome biogenesis GTPase
MQGIIVHNAFNQYLIDDGKTLTLCGVPKTLKLAYKPFVGDRVTFEPISKMISHIELRHHYLERPRMANLEQLAIVISVLEPMLATGLLYRYLTYAILNHLKPLVIITKTDLSVDSLPYSALIDDLALLGITTVTYSHPTKEGLEQIKSHLQSTITAFAGQTGVGKSSLINDLDPNIKQAIGTYSKALGRGRHQTKDVTLFRFQSGFIADTPGFSSLELNVTKEIAARNFPGFLQYAKQCKYIDCLHNEEKLCAIKKAVKDGKISLTSYDEYRTLLENLPHHKEFIK